MAVQYHNLTNQSEYDNKGKVKVEKTKSLRKKAQEIFDTIFNIDRKKEELIIENKQRKEYAKFKGMSPKEFVEMLSKNK